MPTWALMKNFGLVMTLQSLLIMMELLPIVGLFSWISFIARQGWKEIIRGGHGFSTSKDADSGIPIHT